MDTRRLAYYVAIVDCGTITRAAEILHIAQPALSQHMSALESEFGQQFLVRSRKGVVPTAAGRSLYRYAQGMIRLEESARDEIASEAGNPAGTVTIGLAAYSFASSMVVPILQRIRTEYPRIVMRIVESLTVVHSQAIVMGQVDAALIYDPGVVKGVRFERFASEQLVLVAPAGSALAGDGEDVPVADLANVPFILPSRTHTLRRQLKQAFQHAGIEPEIVIEMDHTQPLADAVRLGLGATVLPRTAAEATFPADEFVLRRIVEPTLTLSLSLATPDHHPLSAAAEAVVGVLRDVIGAPGAGERPDHAPL
ncbi:MAG: LysR substrate-binding domain-containing protein [Microbacterium sp.]